MQQTKTFPIPVNYFSIVLGLVSLGLAWRYGVSIMSDLPALVGESLLLSAGIIWLLLFAVYLWKWAAFRQQAIAEIKHELLGCFVSLIPITAMLLGIGLLPYLPDLAEVIIYMNIALQLLFSCYRIPSLWQGTHPEAATTPVLYLPIVATNFVSSNALGVLGYQDWGLFFFGIGFFGWIMLEPAVQRRLRNIAELPAPMRPTLGIQVAPAFVACAAYLNNNGGEIDWLVKMLLGYGVMQLLLIGRLVPWIAEKGFSVGFWAFSFGLASMAGNALHLHHQTQGKSLGIIGLPLFILGSLAIAVLVIMTVRAIVKGQFLLK